MSIDNFLERLLTAVETIAANSKPGISVEAVGAAPVMAASASPAAVTAAAAPAASTDAPATTKKRGRPAGSTKGAAPEAASPTVAPDAPVTSTTAVLDPAVPSTPASDALDDDFLNDGAAKEEVVKEATIEEVRAALMDYRNRRQVAHAGKGTDAAAVAARADAIALLKAVSGHENLTSFTDKTLYGVLVEKANKSS